MITSGELEARLESILCVAEDQRAHLEVDIRSQLKAEYLIAKKMLLIMYGRKYDAKLIHAEYWLIH